MSSVTLCCVHIHNVVAKKRDSSTDLLRRLHGYVKQHNVDFIGCDFNMSAFSTVGDVFSDPEFSAPGNSFLSSCQSVHMSAMWIHVAATSLTMQRLASDLVINPLPVFLHLRTTNLPGTDSIMRSEHAQQRRMERRHNRHDRVRRRRT